MTDGMTHIVKTTHHDTGNIVLFCGKWRETHEEPKDTDPLCPGCFTEALNVLAGRVAETDSTVTNVCEVERKRDHRLLDWVDEITLRLENIETRLNKASKKKGGKR